MNLQIIQNGRARAILRFSIPSIIAMVLTSLITVADGFFIGNYVGKEGLAAVNLGLPIVYLFLAVGLMVSVGGVAIGGMAFGGNDLKKCKGVFNQTICTAVLLTGLLSILVGLCFEPIMGLLGASGRVATYFRAYYGIMLLQLPIMVINSALGMFIRGEGKPQYFMQVNLLNVLLNIVLDYVFVRFVGWGVAGVAIASLISAAVTLLCILHFFMGKAQVFRFGRFTFSRQVLWGTLFNGSSEFVGEISLSISMLAYNLAIMKNVGVDGVTAFTIVGYLCFLFNMVLIGFGQGASPLISFSYGAGERSLAASLRKITNAMVLGAGGLVFLLTLVGAAALGGLFVNSQPVEEMVRTGAMIYGVSFLFCGINVITSFYFTSIGRAVESAIISSARGLVLLLLFIALLPPWLGMVGVWLVAPITELLTLALSLIFIGRDRRRQRACPTVAGGSGQ